MSLDHPTTRKTLGYIMDNLAEPAWRRLLHERARAGEAAIMAATTEETVGSLMRRIDDAGGAANVICAYRDGHAILWFETVARSKPGKVQPVGPTAVLGMLIATLIAAKEPVRIRLGEPVEDRTDVEDRTECAHFGTGELVPA